MKRSKGIKKRRKRTREGRGGGGGEVERRRVKIRKRKKKRRRSSRKRRRKSLFVLSGRSKNRCFISYRKVFHTCHMRYLTGGLSLV